MATILLLTPIGELILPSLFQALPTSTILVSAGILSVRPSNPSTNSSKMDSNEPRGHSCSSSVGSGHSAGTVQRSRVRSFSTTSLASIGSPWAASFQRTGDEAPPRSASAFNLPLLQRSNAPSSRGSAASANVSRRGSWNPILGSSKLRPDEGATSEHQELRLVNVQESEDEMGLAGESESTIQPAADATRPESPLSPLSLSPQPRAFSRWVSTLHRKKPRRPPPTTPRTERWELDDFEGGHTPHDQVGPLPYSPATSRNSSLGFVTAMRSATVTIASASIAAVSRQDSKSRHARQLSLASGSMARSSMDTRRSSIDKAAKQRSRRRREKLEELIRTEESYVADVKALSNAYFTLLGHHQTTASFARTSTHKTIASLLHLHCDILARLHQVVPFAEYDQSVARAPRPTMVGAHVRWHSVDVVPRLDSPVRSKLATIRQGRRSLNISRSEEEDHTTLRCSPQLVATVAQIFSDHMSRFQVYEEFGARYELVQRDLDEVQRTLLSWSDYDRGIEVISSSVNPVKSREANRRKALTVKDLLIKPIQRLPRYELLFGDLCKFTPVCDDPESHVTIEGLLEQLNGTCKRMNLAKDSPDKARMMEVTWLIGDRLSYSGQVPRSVYLELLGPVVLCGCLHIAYRGKDRIKGYYAICILFESTFLVATADEDQQKYFTKAGVTLANAAIEEADNGKGLQCHTAPHSWKIIFEHAARMYEIIFTACSAPEALAWRQNVTKRIELQSQAVTQGVANALPLSSPLIDEMRSVGKAFGKSGSFVRRMSVHRTATVGPTTEMNQVVINNTQAEKENPSNSSHSSLQIPRSQSVFTPAHIQKLAPQRTDRTRLEALLIDVWTKEQIPYPGMTRRDGTRAFVRKFSMASITSNFSSKQRNASHTSIQSRKEEMPPPNKLSKSSVREHPKLGRPKVNFHDAPEAFLPADFELQDPAKKKRSALRTFTMTMERPFSPLLGKDEKPSGVRRTQSVRDVAAEPSIGPFQDRGNSTAVYSVPHERWQTPSQTRSGQDMVEEAAGLARSPRKSKSRNRLRRLFG